MPYKFEIEYHVKSNEELEFLESRMEQLLQHVSLNGRLMKSEREGSYDLEVYKSDSDSIEDSIVLIDPDVTLSYILPHLRYKSRNPEGKLVDLEVDQDSDVINIRIDEDKYSIRLPQRNLCTY